MAQAVQPPPSDGVSTPVDVVGRCNTDNIELCVISYNMHGFRQGSPAVRDMMLSMQPDVILLQEHWLTPANLSKFQEEFPQYMCFGSSAMRTSVESGVLQGRPFGGVMILVSKRLQSCTELVCAADRYVILTVGDLIFVNIYLPCVGTADRLLICDDIFADLLSFMCKFPYHKIFIGGDFNVDLDVANQVSDFVNGFLFDNALQRCDKLFSNNVMLPCRIGTYFNDTTGRESVIDYFVTNDKGAVINFEVLDLHVNFSDHRPIAVRCICTVRQRGVLSDEGHSPDASNMTVKQLRWDHADLQLYRSITGVNLQSVLDDIMQLEQSHSVTLASIDDIYCRVLDILRFASDSVVPNCTKNFFKFWWNQELDILKADSIKACQIWKAAGRPRSGAVFDSYRKAKSAYRSELRSQQQNEELLYTNELHDALQNKRGPSFWKCWNSKFENKKNMINTVDGITDPKIIADHFVSHFSKACSNNSDAGATRLKKKYEQMRSSYCGQPVNESARFDAELVENVIAKLKRGKAAGLDGITAEHLQYSHVMLFVVLAKLFNLMICISHVPASFGESYTVPLLKISNSAYSKSITVNDFRGISISPVISKVFEHCILDRYAKFFWTSDNQFGFKKQHGCSHAIYTLRCVVDSYLASGSTVNICALDISKAFDKMNHRGLFIKLMDRGLPNKLLALLENWFNIGVTCVKWCNVYSAFFELSCGIRQGGVLSPYLFAVFIDSVAQRVRASGTGCYVKFICVSVILYADDILLIAPSVTALQQLLYVCEAELAWLDMAINVGKSACMRIGVRHSAKCMNIRTVDGREISWCDKIRYLGIYLKSAGVFRCSYDNAKRSFYRAFNAIFGKVGRLASEDVMIQLLRTKCLPVLYYGLEACPVTKTQTKSLDYALHSCFRKIFSTRDQAVVHDCMVFFDISSVSESVKCRQQRFFQRYQMSPNTLCMLFSDKTTVHLE